MFNASSSVWDGSPEKIVKVEIQHLEKISVKALKRILSLPITNNSDSSMASRAKNKL